VLTIAELKKKQLLNKSDTVKDETVQDIAFAIREKGLHKPEKHNEVLGSTLLSLGNIAAGGLILGQAFGGFEFSVVKAIVGAISVILLYLAGYQVIKKGGDNV